MMIQINQALCAGCGVCVDACSFGALRLVNDRAEIDAALCTQCEACVEACPNGAIGLQSQVPSGAMIPLRAAESYPLPVQDRVALPETKEPTRRGLVSLAGAALAFLGSEVAPRLVDVFITALDRKLAQPKTSALTPYSTLPRVKTMQRRGKRLQARYRSRQNGLGNRKGRR